MVHGPVKIQIQGSREGGTCANHNMVSLKRIHCNIIEYNINNTDIVFYYIALYYDIVQCDIL